MMEMDWCKTYTSISTFKEDIMRFKFKNLTAQLNIDNVPEFVNPMDLIVEAMGKSWKKVENLVACRNAGDNSSMTDELFRRLIQAHIDREYP